MIRAGLFYELGDEEAALVIASYETSVADRMWHLRLTGTTHTTVLETASSHSARRTPERPLPAVRSPRDS